MSGSTSLEFETNLSEGCLTCVLPKERVMPRLILAMARHETIDGVDINFVDCHIKCDGPDVTQQKFCNMTAAATFCSEGGVTNKVIFDAQIHD